jgi:AcrR family transcriptional regulator
MVRPRSVRAHNSVVSAALRLFAERGIDATSMDAIADASGVSKATIYKHWSDKDALCLEVMTHVHGHDASIDEPESGDLRADLISVLSHGPPEELAELRTRLMPHLIAYGVRHPAFGKAWRTRALEPPRTRLKRLLERGIERGLLPATLKVDAAIAQLFGPMMYAYVMTLIDRESPADLEEEVVDAFLTSHSPTTRRTRRRKRRGR